MEKGKFFKGGGFVGKENAKEIEIKTIWTGAKQSELIFMNKVKNTLKFPGIS